MSALAPAEYFEGHAGRECGEHRTTGYRAWCFDCHEWCYPSDPCKGCELGRIKAQRPQRRARQKPVQEKLVDVPATKPAGWTSDCWSTPPEMVREKEAEFGAFDLDPCATAESAKAPKFYTVFENGLLQPWFGRVWLNPPYSDPTPWLQRAVAAQEDGCLVVALLPASTDANWFHDLVLPNAEVRFIRQRVRFIGWRGTPIPSPIAPNLWAIFHPKGRNG